LLEELKLIKRVKNKCYGWINPMPFSILKQGTHYKVINKLTGKIHAKHTTKVKALAQLRILKNK
jgi:hypothetical protein